MTLMQDYSVQQEEDNKPISSDMHWNSFWDEDPTMADYRDPLALSPLLKHAIIEGNVISTDERATIVVPAISDKGATIRLSDPFSTGTYEISTSQRRGLVCFLPAYCEGHGIKSVSIVRVQEKCVEGVPLELYGEGLTGADSGKRVEEVIEHKCKLCGESVSWGERRGHAKRHKPEDIREALEIGRTIRAVAADTT